MRPLSTEDKEGAVVTSRGLSRQWVVHNTIKGVLKTTGGLKTTRMVLHATMVSFEFIGTHYSQEVLTSTKIVSG